MFFSHLSLLWKYQQEACQVALYPGFSEEKKNIFSWFLDEPSSSELGHNQTKEIYF